MEEDFDPTELGRSSLQDKSAKRDWAQNRSDKLILPQPTWVSGRDSDRSNNIITSSGLGQQFGSSITNGAIGLGDRVSASGGLVNAMPHIRRKPIPPQVFESVKPSKIKILNLIDPFGNAEMWIEGFKKNPVKVDIAPYVDDELTYFLFQLDNLGGINWQISTVKNYYDGFILTDLDFVSISSIPEKNWVVIVGPPAINGDAYANYMGYGFWIASHPIGGTGINYRNLAVIDGILDTDYPDSDFDTLGSRTSIILPGSYFVDPPDIRLAHYIRSPFDPSIARANADRTRMYASEAFANPPHLMFLRSAPTAPVNVPSFQNPAEPFSNDFTNFFFNESRFVSLINDSIYHVYDYSLTENIARIRHYRISDTGDTTIREFDEPFFPLQPTIGTILGVKYHPS